MAQQGEFNRQAAIGLIEEDVDAEAGLGRGQNSERKRDRVHAVALYWIVFYVFSFWTCLSLFIALYCVLLAAGGYGGGLFSVACALR